MDQILLDFNGILLVILYGILSYYKSICKLGTDVISKNNTVLIVFMLISNLKILLLLYGKKVDKINHNYDKLANPTE